MLERTRLFVRHYPQMANVISAPPARNFPSHAQRLAHEISAPVRKSVANGPVPLAAEKILCLSWTHLADIVRIDDMRLEPGVDLCLVPSSLRPEPVRAREGQKMPCLQRIPCGARLATSPHASRYNQFAEAHFQCIPIRTGD